MRKPNFDMKIFADRRKKLMDRAKDAAIVVASHPERIRNDDVHFLHRQDSNMFYLTAFEEPEAILILRPGLKPDTVMFVRQRNRERETWDGFRYGPEGVKNEFKIEQTYPIEEFAQRAPDLLKDFQNVYYRMGKNEFVDKLLKDALEASVSLNKRKGYGLASIRDADTFIGEMRVIKSDYEIEQLREACEISAQAHLAAMKFTRPGVSERQVQGVLASQFYMKGSAREGYNYIVASGNSATTLHYNFNDQVCQDGDLLLIDAGAEFNFYTGDITRTYPVNGKFTSAQARVYQAVLDVQKKIIDFIEPGVTFLELQEMGSSLLTDKMLELGLLNGRKEDIIAAGEHRRFYPHGIGHWLGMDVHDAGAYYVDGKPRPLEVNMCFTVEPGLYIPYDDETVPKEYRGIGVRIEDNVRVTAGGCENLTTAVPKEINEIEAVVGRGL